MLSDPSSCSSPVADEQPHKPRILIVDDHPVVRAGIRARLAIEPDLEVCGEAATAAEADRLIHSLKPDLVLMDLSLSDRNGVDLIKSLRAGGVETRILVVSAHDEEMFAERCIRAGAQGFVCKTAAPDLMVVAIRRLLGDACYLSDAMTTKILRAFRGGARKSSQGTLDSLSDRELQVYQAIGEGLSVKQIAVRYFLSPKTVDTYRTKLKQKLGLHSSHQLARHAMQWVLDSPQPNSASDSAGPCPP